MAKTVTASQLRAAVKTALQKKEADLDMMDDQLLGMDAEMPADTMSNDFDMLAQKRNDLEDNIRKMRERIELISAWEQLKNGDWSEEVKNLLKDLDMNIAEIADNSTGEVVPPVGMAAPPAPVPPVAPGAPAVPPVAPPAPEVTEALPETPPEETPAVEVPEGGEELPGTTASKKNDFSSSNKKGNFAPVKKEGIMTQTATKLALKPELVAAKAARESLAKTRIAAAFSIAKTMLPGAPIEVHRAFTASLLQNSTKVLKAALRQTAVNAYNTKLADDIKRKHKMELNDLLEEPSVLSGLKREVETEVKGDAKNASGKQADDRKDAGPQNETYNDGRGCGGGTHTEPKETDAGKAGDRPVNTINKSEEGDKAVKAAAEKCAECKDGKKCAKHASVKQAHGEDCKGCEKCEGKKAAQSAIKAASAACKECKEGSMCSKHAAASKYADDMPPMDGPAEGVAPEGPAGDAGAAPVEEGPVGGDAPSPEMGAPGAEAESTTVLTEEKKMEMTEKIDEAEQAIQGLLADIEGENNAAEEGVAEMAELPGGEVEGQGEELKIEDIFNQGEMEDKESSLANQGDNSVMADGDSVESFFGPSASSEMEACLEPQTASIQEMFSVEGSDADPMAVLFGSTKEAGDVAGTDVLPSFTSETATHFQTDTSKGDGRDSGSDHESDIWAEALDSVKFEDSGQKRVKQDETNVMEEAPEGKKAAQKKAAYTGPIRPQAPKQAAGADLGEALLGSFFGDGK
jgi:hypothetical protein